jgi:tetratricopeptide (TPR) repeat protein
MKNRLPPTFAKHLKPAPRLAVKPVQRTQSDDETLKLAMALHLEGKLREAEQLCFRLLMRNPRNPKALYLAGMLALDIEDSDLAIQYLERAVKEMPREPRFLIALANAYRDSHEYEIAIKHYGSALLVRPNSVEALVGLARAHVGAGTAEAALSLFEKALKIDPEHTTARLGWADAMTSLGRMDDAAGILQGSIERRKSVGAAYAALANTRKFTSETPELKAILDELGSEQRGAIDAVRLHHAAGKICNDLKRYDEAIDHYQKAKTISGHDYDVEAYRRWVDTMIAVMSPALLNAKAGLGHPSETPVFVVGMPRSGTTLTEQICASHPSVFGAGELTKLRRVARQAGFSKENLTTFRNSMFEMTTERSQELAAQYLDYLEMKGADAPRIVDKMPHNFELVGFIALIFPNARIIHCRRDAIDNCISCFVTNFNDKHGYNTDLTKLGLYYREHDRLMRHWHAVLPGRIHEVRYETMIADQEAESRRLIDFLGLPWDDACLHFHEQDRSVTTPSRWQVRQPIYKSSVKRWKNYENKIQPLIEALGDLAEV